MFVRVAASVLPKASILACRAGRPPPGASKSRTHPRPGLGPHRQTTPHLAPLNYAIAREAADCLRLSTACGPTVARSSRMASSKSAMAR
jgi:hypothetical protein